MIISDESANDHYARPENQAPSDTAAQRRSSKPQLSSHIPVRFRPEVIAKVRVLALRDGKTVSSWIRDLVQREVDRLLPERVLRDAKKT